MARAYARWKLGALSSDPEIRALTPHAKLLYIFLIQDVYLNAAGVMPLCDEEWAEDLGFSGAEMEKALEELELTRFIVVGEKRRDVMIRTFIRNDGIAEQPNVLKQALAHARLARSKAIRRALADELRRLPAPPPNKIDDRGRVRMAYPDPHACADELDPEGAMPKPPNPSGNPSPNPSEKGLEQPFGEGMPEPPGEGKGESLGSSVVSSSSDSAAPSSDAASKPRVEEPQRDDVDALCARLRDWMVLNEVREPVIGKRWKQQARLLLDQDKRELSKALNLIDWCQQDTFWKANIQSIPTFREKYDRLALQAREEWRRNGARSKASSDAVNPDVNPWAGTKWV